MRLFFELAIRNLVRSRRRSLILGGALALVTSSLVLMLALSTGLNDTIVRSTTVLLTGHVNVGGFYKYKATDAHAVVTEPDSVEAVVRETLPNVRSIVRRMRGFATLTSETDSLQSVLAGVAIENEPALLKALDPTGERGDVSRLAEPNTIVVFAEQARRLGVRAGDRLTLSAQLLDGTVNTADVEVVAVAEDVGQISGWNAFVNPETVRRFYRLGPDTTGVVMVYLDTIEKAEFASAELRRALESKGYELMRPVPRPYWEKFSLAAGQPWTGQRLDVSTWRDEAATLNWTISAVTTVSGFLLTVLLVIIVVGISNVMWIAVKERSREVGTLRAIGMSRGSVLAMLIVESSVLGAFFSTLGAGAAVFVCWAIDRLELQVPSEAMRAVLLSDVIHLSVSGVAVVLAVALLTVVAVLAGLWPAFAASRLPPITAIQRTG
ncbi:MAG: FtsX-like permease family protein [Myxococcota bacterium]